VAVKNCMTGTLPANLCNASALTSLVLSGLSSNEHCGSAVRVPLTGAYAEVPGGVHGRIPQCVFSLPRLRQLHLAGNGLDGRIPGNLSAASPLTTLVLAHNRLSGTISRQLQARPFELLDLSFNRLSGTCEHFGESSFNTTDTSYNSTKIVLSENFLSGRLPRAFEHAGDVDVLAGNLLQCSAASVPASDPAAGDYICGSDDLDAALYAWLGAALAAAAGGALGVVFFTKMGKEERLVDLLPAVHNRVADQYTAISNFFLEHFAEFPHTSAFIYHLREIRVTSVCVCAVIVLLYGSVSVGIKAQGGGGGDGDGDGGSSSSSSTYTHQQRWAWSALFQRGALAAAVCVAAWLLAVAAFAATLMLPPRQRQRQRQHRHALGPQGAGPGASLSGDTTATAATAATAATGYFSNAASRFIHSEPLRFSVAIACNAAVVCAANGAYVRLMLAPSSRGQKALYRVSLVLFNTAWGGAASALVRAVFAYTWTPPAPAPPSGPPSGPSGPRRYQSMNLAMTFVPVFNSVIAPLLAACLLDASCLLPLLAPADSSEYTYSYDTCIFYKVYLPDPTDPAASPALVCDVYAAAAPLSTAYAPAWRYSFACSSSALQLYVPVLLAACLLRAAGAAAYALLGCRGGRGAAYVHSYIHPYTHLYPSWLPPPLPPLLWPANPPAATTATTATATPLPLLGLSTDGDRDRDGDRGRDRDRDRDRGRGSVPLLDATKLIALTRSHVAVLLTFGFASPPLALAATAAVLAQCYLWEYLVGSYALTRYAEAARGEGESRTATLDTRSTTIEEGDVGGEGEGEEGGGRGSRQKTVSMVSLPPSFSRSLSALDGDSAWQGGGERESSNPMLPPHTGTSTDANANKALAAALVSVGSLDSGQDSGRVHWGAPLARLEAAARDATRGAEHWFRLCLCLSAALTVWLCVDMLGEGRVV
jgi:hypothetical protein